jgi:hypothetical protein
MVPASSKSNPTDKLSRFDLLILGIAVVICAVIYLLAANFTYRIGFPLDDSWIHQTYARNLALRGEWAFRPGILSAGSTSPFWSILLSLGFIIHLSPYIWTYLLGALTLFVLAGLCEWAARRLITKYRPFIPWIGIFIVFEWHLSWASMSGMETLLQALIITAVLILLITKSQRYLTIGLLTGLSVWVRPDGLTLMGPVLVTIYFERRDSRSCIHDLTLYLIGLGMLLVPYLTFNIIIGGAPMPNTFYAKQAEYAIWQAKPILERLGQMLLQLLIGTGVVLLPGVIGRLVIAIRRRDWGTLAAFLWCFSYMGLYMYRLPVYQHGRYLMPAMPIFFLFGLLTLVEFSNANLSIPYHNLTKTVWQDSLAILWLVFVYIGARSYAQDVAVIESEMVATAEWSAGNLPAGALIAAHDIGALGYFDDHPLLDLAGLISPDVVPIIRDEPRLADYLNKRGADYLIAFPGFYPRLVRGLQPVFITKGSFAPLFGQENMTVYRWDSP